jgi:uncharacterized lipoprotein YajG
MKPNPCRHARSVATLLHTFSQRDFLKVTGSGIDVVTLAGCGTPPPVTLEPSPTATSTSTATLTSTAIQRTLT